MQSLCAFSPPIKPCVRSRRPRAAANARKVTTAASVAAAAVPDDGNSPTTSTNSSSSTSSTSTSTTSTTSSSSSSPRPPSRSPRVAVIGGGWAGFGAAKALSERGYDVTLLDAAPGAGASAAGWRTTSGGAGAGVGGRGGAVGRSMEAGIKGMWYDYPNVDALLLELGISDCLTDYSTSGFWAAPGRKTGGGLGGLFDWSGGSGGSRRGGKDSFSSSSSSPSSSSQSTARLINEAPVFSKLPRLPTPLGQAFHTRDYFRTLSLLDRASVLPIVAAAADVRSSPERYQNLDKTTARELFKQIGVTEAVYRDFLEPTLLVALFAAPEQLSAAETLNALYYYALKTQASFDVRWCKGSIAERIFAPLAQRIRESGGKILGGAVVERVDVDERTNSITAVHGTDRETGAKISVDDLDAVVFAVGVRGMQELVLNNRDTLGTRDEFARTLSLKTIDCASVRLWFDRARPTRFAANVLAGFDGDATGGTFFNLNQLQDEYREPRAEGCIASDFYGASQLLALPDEALVRKTRANLEACEPQFRDAKLVDACVARARGAVTAFSPGSLLSRPRQETSFANVFIAGDYVRGVEAEVSAEGLSQERALATGLKAAALVAGRCGGVGAGVGGAAAPVVVLKGLQDEPHIALLKGALSASRAAAAAVGLRSPFLS